MKIWMSGEIQADAYDAYVKNRKLVTQKFNEYFENKNYGDGLLETAYIGIIREIDSPDYDEIKRYHKKDKDVEFRLKIAHDVFLVSDENKQLKLVAQSVMRAIKLIPELKKIPDFDYAAFESDALKLWKINDWF